LMQVNLISSSSFHNPKPLIFFIHWFLDDFFSIYFQDCVVRSNRNWKECQKGTYFLYSLSLYIYLWDCNLGFNISKFLVYFMRKYRWFTHVFCEFADYLFCF
jgi:hypothetical protein